MGIQHSCYLNVKNTYILCFLIKVTKIQALVAWKRRFVLVIISKWHVVSITNLKDFLLLQHRWRNTAVHKFVSTKMAVLLKFLDCQWTQYCWFVTWIFTSHFRQFSSVYGHHSFFSSVIPDYLSKRQIRESFTNLRKCRIEFTQSWRGPFVLEWRIEFRKKINWKCKIVLC